MANLINSEEEIWKDIYGFEGYYQISNYGKVKSLKRTYTNKLGVNRVIGGRIRNTTLDTGGYPQVSIYKGCKIYTVNIHLLVWDHFGNKPRQAREVQVDHIDENKLNPFIGNLRLLKSRANKSKSVRRSDLPTGVNINGKKFYAKYRIGKKQVYIGTFTTIQAASDAYKKAVRISNFNRRGGAHIKMAV